MQKAAKINIKAIILITIVTIKTDALNSLTIETAKVKTDIITERIEIILLGRGLFILYSYISHCSFLLILPLITFYILLEIYCNYKKAIFFYYFSCFYFPFIKNYYFRYSK